MVYFTLIAFNRLVIFQISLEEGTRLALTLACQPLMSFSPRWQFRLCAIKICIYSIVAPNFH